MQTTPRRRRTRQWPGVQQHLLNFAFVCHRRRRCRTVFIPPICYFIQSRYNHKKVFSSGSQFLEAPSEAPTLFDEVAFPKKQNHLSGWSSKQLSSPDTPPSSTPSQAGGPFFCALLSNPPIRSDKKANSHYNKIIQVEMQSRPRKLD